MAQVKYDASSIEVLSEDRERVQKQAHIYIPDKRLAGCLHLIREIVDNSQDEVMQVGGYVEVTYNEKTREVTVEDNGRGVPLERLQELCEVLNSSGKFSKGMNSAYAVGSGVHGIGNKLANFLSDYYEIVVMRDGKRVTRKYEDGFFKKELVEKVDKTEHGTFTKFRISDKYLKETDKVTCANIMKMIEEKADACPGFIIKFKGVRKDGSKVKEKYEGLSTEELFKKYCKATSKVWYFNYEPKDSMTRCRVGFGYNSKAVADGDINVRGWCNYIFNKEGGTHIDAITDAIYDHFKKYMYKDFLSEKDKKTLQLRKEDVRLGLCGVVVMTTNEPEYQGQYKEKFISVSIGEEIEAFVRKQLNKMTDADIRAIAIILRDNIKARMSSIKARQQVKKVGNGLSKDSIEKYIPKKMGCTTDYTEVYIVEGDSAGGHAEAARYDFQGVYKLRGKVDNIYDCPTSELLKKDIIADLSRIVGLIPGKRGNVDDIVPDKIMVLTDADPDGYSIRCGVIVIFMRAFPQVIEDGRLYVVEPPLFGFRDSGKQMFASTNREYITYLQGKFSKNNDLFYKKEKMSKTEVKEFLLRNEQYLDLLKKVADSNICSMPFMELICANLNKIGVTKKDIPKWDKLVKEQFSPQLKASWVDGYIEISGIKDDAWEMIELNGNFIESKKTRKLIDLMGANLGRIYGYSIDGKDSAKNLSLMDVLNIFGKYKGSDLERYKGLGQMEAEDLRHTCMEGKNQRLVQITTKDVDKAFERLALWHSTKQASRDSRRDFMLEYIPDLKELST